MPAPSWRGGAAAPERGALSGGGCKAERPLELGAVQRLGEDAGIGDSVQVDGQIDAVKAGPAALFRAGDASVRIQFNRDGEVRVLVDVPRMKDDFIAAG